MPMICDPKAGKSGRERQLDYEKCFRYWLELGTLKKVVMAMERDGDTITMDDGTEKPFSVYSIQAGAWIWVINHPDESLAIWQKKGYFLSGKDDDWKRWVSVKIRKFIKTDVGIKRALEINGIKEWYDEYYKFGRKS